MGGKRTGQSVTVSVYLYKKICGRIVYYGGGGRTSFTELRLKCFISMFTIESTKRGGFRITKDHNSDSEKGAIELRYPIGTACKHSLRNIKIFFG